MSSNKEQLLTILKSLREYIANEYTVNADGSKGGDSTMSVDHAMDSDWTNKLDPMSGGQGGEREGAVGKTTSNASQGTDPYLHKQKQTLLKQDLEEEVEEEEEEVEEEVVDTEEEEEEEITDFLDEEETYAGHGGAYEKSADATIVTLLKDVKGLLQERHVEKQAMAEVRSEISDLQKSLDTSINDGIKSGMKKFGFAPSSGDIKRVGVKKSKTQKTNVVEGHQDRIQKSVEAPDARIGVEGDSLVQMEETATPDGQQNQFVDAVETILKSNETDDLRGTFRKVNSMRDQQGEMQPSTLYYNKVGGNE
jgi:hypothetical protein